MNKLTGAVGSERSEVFNLDTVDRAIISELQVDGRMSYAELGPRVGMSQAAVRQRVNRLIDRGVMQVVAVTDPLSLGLSTQAMVGITVSGDVRTVAAAVADLVEAEYVLITRLNLGPEYVVFKSILKRSYSRVPRIFHVTFVHWVSRYS